MKLGRLSMAAREEELDGPDKQKRMNHNVKVHCRSVHRTAAQMLCRSSCSTALVQSISVLTCCDGRRAPVVRHAPPPSASGWWTNPIATGHSAAALVSCIRYTEGAPHACSWGWHGQHSSWRASVSGAATACQPSSTSSKAATAGSATCRASTASCRSVLSCIFALKILAACQHNPHLGRPCLWTKGRAC